MYDSPSLVRQPTNMYDSPSLVRQPTNMYDSSSFGIFKIVLCGLFCAVNILSEML